MVLIRPDSLTASLDLLADKGPSAMLLAGGQSLIPMMSAGLLRPELLIDLQDVHPAEPVSVDGEAHIVIGLGCTHADIEKLSGPAHMAAPILRDAAKYIASPPVRNRGTFLGSIAHADPSAEWPAVAAAFDANFTIESRGNSRTVRFDELFLGPLMTALEPGEILVEARLAQFRRGPDRWTGGAIEELAYRQGDYAVVGAVVVVTIDGNARVDDARIAMFGIGEVGRRLEELEEALRGSTPEGFRDVASLASEIVEPPSDAAASSAYRARMSAVMVRRGLEKAYEDALERRDSLASR